MDTTNTRIFLAHICVNLNLVINKQGAGFASGSVTRFGEYALGSFPFHLAIVQTVLILDGELGDIQIARGGYLLTTLEVMQVFGVQLSVYISNWSHSRK